MTKSFGPGFEEARSVLYRAEYGVISVAIVGCLVWKGLLGGGVDTLQTVLWFLIPDLIAFIPIGLSSKRREWPSWGIYLHNSVHNLIVWGIVFFLGWIVIGVPSWPLFGWLGHITVDRTVGYGLRKLEKKTH